MPHRMTKLLYNKSLYFLSRICLILMSAFNCLDAFLQITPVWLSKWLSKRSPLLTHTPLNCIPHMWKRGMWVSINAHPKSFLHICVHLQGCLNTSIFSTNTIKYITELWTQKLHYNHSSYFTSLCRQFVSAEMHTHTNKYIGAAK